MRLFMFDILVYVFENYLPGACPEPDALARKLSAAGFEDDEISEALQWLAVLDQAQEEFRYHRLPQASSQRFYDEQEMSLLLPECRGFVAFLESAKAIDATAREMIVERAMAQSEEHLCPVWAMLKPGTSIKSTFRIMPEQH